MGGPAEAGEGCGPGWYCWWGWPGEGVVEGGVAAARYWICVGWGVS